MVITAEQKTERKKHLGSSDMPAILGCDPYRSAHDVYLEKTGQLKEQKESAAMDIGNMMEVGVLDYAERELGPLDRNVHGICSQLPILQVNTDAVLKSANEPVEGKTANILRPYAVNENWGEEFTDDIPNYTIVQSHVHMICLKSEICHVPALIGGRGLCMFTVNINVTMVELILNTAKRFWTENVQKGIPPSDSMPHLEVIKRIKRVPNKVVDVDPVLVQKWMDAKEAHKAAEAEKEMTQEALLAVLQDAEQGNAKGLGIVTYFETSRKGYEVKPCTFRTARFKKA